MESSTVTCIFPEVYECFPLATSRDALHFLFFLRKPP